MKRRLCISLLPVSVLLTAILILSLLYPYYEDLLRVQLNRQADLVASGIESYGTVFLENMGTTSHQVVVTSADGTVIYGNPGTNTDLLSSAVQEGKTEVTVYQDLWNEQFLAVSRILSDGKILWVCVSQFSIYALMKSLLQPVLVVLAVSWAAALLIFRFVPEHKTSTISNP